MQVSMDVCTKVVTAAYPEVTDLFFIPLLPNLSSLHIQLGEGV